MAIEILIYHQTAQIEQNSWVLGSDGLSDDVKLLSTNTLPSGAHSSKNVAVSK